ncbi:Di-copper centre-containing protein [Curvularia clavata]|uniref:Di-copper centre-containing protein n=1 Tax=Curvularia clavata TaxID=95742 RepID=A0A9Q8ZBH0_CURCL|nr:Di-copper centre-containing protein [Curvularia clavata]
MAGPFIPKALVAALCLTLGAFASPFDKIQDAATKLANIQHQALENAYKVLDNSLSDSMSRVSTCNRDTVAVRKEFGDLTKAERKAYTNAVKCLLESPSKLPTGQYPGAKSRYDDFVNMTPSIHSTANFLHWHRYYVWAYETALRNECQYAGYQPYWDWSKYSDLVHSPIFNGDEWSMGSNGDAIGPHGGMNMGPGSPSLPGGPGGGCVTSGPFANLTIHLGPVMPTMDPALKIPSNPRADGYGDNPRCLRRDVSNFLPERYLRPDDLLRHIESSNDIATFQDTLQMNMSNPLAALHSAGHYSVWGDPGGDVYVSPGEPFFWLHHTQLDRHWWMWTMYIESQLKTRTSMYEGGTNWMLPDSPRGSPDDKQEMGVAAPESMNHLASRDLFSTTGGPLCYVYA